MNREELKALGLTDEQINSVMASHGTVVNATKEELTTVTTDRDSLKGQLTDRDTQLEALKTKATGNEDLTAEIERLKGENQTTASEYQEKLDKQAFDFSLEKALTGAKVRNPKAVKALLDIDSIKLDGEKLLGLDDQIKALQESDDYLFESEEGAGGNPNFTTGQHNKGSGVNPFSKGSINLTEQTRLFREDKAKYDQFKANAK